MPVDRRQDQSLRLVLALSFLAGFVSMSQEIVWVVLLGFTTSGSPMAFADVLGFLLLGTAVGSLLGGSFSKSAKDGLFRPLACGGALSAMVYLASVPVIERLITVNETLGVMAICLLIFAVACLWGAAFPLLCAAGVLDDQRAGWRVSWVYLANILGAVFGPLLTGLCLLDRLPLKTVVELLVVCTLLFVGLALLSGSRELVKRKGFLGACAIAALLLGVSLFAENIPNYARLYWKELYQPDRDFSRIVQNRYGVISVESAPTSDILYGGGAYDGQFNVDPVLNSNGIRRAYMLASLHRNPEEVLMIGLGSGSWARVVADHEAVESLEVVEINPGYVDLVRDYPEVSSLLDVPKVTITIDDGRRWLRRHPDRQYDLIVMNSTFHWRNQMTYLLSEEFFTLCRQRLAPGGVFYFNTTFSKDVVYTLAKVFPFVTTVEGFAAASMQPFDLSADERFDNLLRFRNDGRMNLDPNRLETRRILQELTRRPLPDVRIMLDREPDLMPITDDNMATEFKRERRWHDSEWSWASFWRRLQQGAPGRT